MSQNTFGQPNPFGQPSPFGGGPGGEPTGSAPAPEPEDGGGKRTKMLALGGGGLAAIVLAGGAALFLTGGDDEADLAAAPPPPAAAAPTESATVAPAPLPTVAEFAGRNPFKAKIVEGTGGGAGGGETAGGSTGGTSTPTVDPDIVPSIAPTGGGSSFGGTTGGVVAVPMPTGSAPTVTKTVTSTVTKEVPGPTVTVTLPFQPHNISLVYLGQNPGKDGDLGTEDDPGEGLFAVIVDDFEPITGSVPVDSPFAVFAPLSWMKYTGVNEDGLAKVQIGDVLYELEVEKPQKLY